MEFQFLEAEIRSIVATQDYTRRLPEAANGEAGKLASAVNLLLAGIEARQAAMNSRLDLLADARDDAQTTNRLLKRLKNQLQERGQALDAALHKAAAASSAKSLFLANMSHEIRTPLNGILGMAELLNRSNLDAKQAQQVATVISSGRALLSIINDILDFSKIESGKFELDCKPCDLFLCLGDIIQLLAPAASRKGLELKLELDPDLPRNYIGDAGRLRQIIMNLAGNSVKFTDHGSVTVRLSGVARDSEADLNIEVIDTGVGIPADKLTTVFEKFSQVDNSGTRRFEGTGLGLSICQHLVARMGSAITVESTVGKGSTFAFRLTLPVHHAAPYEPVAPVALHGLRIVLTGETDMLDIIAPVLQKNGCNVAIPKKINPTAESGFQIAVIAVNELNGLKLQMIEALSANGSLSRIPVIVVVQQGAPGDARIVADAGAAAYLSGIPNNAELLKAIQKVLAAHALCSMNDGDKSKLSHSTLITRHSLAESDIRDAIGAQTGGGSSAEGRRILVIDDSLVNQEIAREFLADLQCEVEVAGDGREGLNASHRSAFDLILMDCQMPVMDGFEATNAIRTNRSAATRHNVPIIALTANAFASDREKCLAAGMSDFISKPFLPDDFHETVLRWLNAPAAG